MTHTAKEVAEYIGAKVEGDANLRVAACASAELAGADDVIFVDAEKHAEAAQASRANCVIARPGFSFTGKTVLRAEKPKLAFARAAMLLHPATPIAHGIHATAIIAQTAKLGDSVSVGPFAVIEDGVEIGAGSEIGPYAFVGRGVLLGAGCRLHPRVTLYSALELARAR